MQSYTLLWCTNKNESRNKRTAIPSIMNEYVKNCSSSNNKFHTFHEEVNAIT